MFKALHNPANSILSCTRKLTIFFILASMASSTCAELSEATIDRLIAASCAEVQINALPEVMRAFSSGIITQNAASDDPVNLEVILDNMATSEGFFEKIRMELDQRLSERDAEVLLAWFDSPEGRRVTRAEEDASTVAAIRDIQRRAASLLLNERRVELAREINRINDSDAMFLDIQEQTIIRMVRAIHKIDKPAGQPELSEIKALMEQNRAQNLAGLEQASLVSIVYTYKKMEYSLIESYIAFLKTPEATQFGEAIKRGIRQELMRSADKMAEALALEIHRVRAMENANAL